MRPPAANVPGLSIVEADLNSPEHASAITRLTAAYAEDAMGSGAPLPRDVLDRLIDGLRQTTSTVVWLAYAEGTAVGLATCFIGFSTFAARPVINVHDLSVLESHRGRGVGRALLEAVEEQARAMGCAKITLEVGELNHRARRMYEAYGFRHASAGVGAGPALFYSKPI